jgi:hypothetical protein
LTNQINYWSVDQISRTQILEKNWITTGEQPVSAIY